MLKRKSLPEGSLKVKARLVARGDKHPADTYDLTFSPVATFSALVALITASYAQGMFLGTFDVNSRRPSWPPLSMNQYLCALLPAETSHADNTSARTLSCTVCAGTVEHGAFTLFI